MTYKPLITLMQGCHIVQIWCNMPEEAAWTGLTVPEQTVEIGHHGRT